MDRKEIIESLRRDLFLIKDTKRVTLNEGHIKELSGAMEEAIKFLERQEHEILSYPYDLLLDLGYIPDEEDEALLLRLLETSLTRIPASERDILERKYKGGESIETIAKGLNITAKSADELVKNALTSLSIKVRAMVNSHKRSAGASRAAAKRRKNAAPKKRLSKDPRKILDEDIEMLGLSPRSCNALKRAGYMKIGDIKDIDIETLKKVKGLGGMCLSEVRIKAADKGIRIISDEYV